MIARIMLCHGMHFCRCCNILQDPISYFVYNYIEEEEEGSNHT